MKRETEVARRLATARRLKDYESCISLCRQGSLLHNIPNTEEWYSYRISLAGFLMAHDRVITSDDVDESIEIYRAVLMHEHDEKRRSGASLGLGWAYYLARNGDVSRNLAMSAECLTDALNYYKKDRDSYTWSGIKSMLGMVYSCMANEQDESLSLLLKAITSYKEALEALVESVDREEHGEIVQKLNALTNRVRLIESDGERDKVLP